MELNDIAKMVYDNCVEKGFHEEASESERETISAMVSNLHSEVSELWEAYREGRLHMPCDKDATMRNMGLDGLTCAEEELADVIIRALDDLMMLGSNPEKVILTKHMYNKQRTWKHGGKLA